VSPSPGDKAGIRESEARVQRLEAEAQAKSEALQQERSRLSALESGHRQHPTVNRGGQREGGDRQQDPPSQVRTDPYGSVTDPYGGQPQRYMRSRPLEGTGEEGWSQTPPIRTDPYGSVREGGLSESGWDGFTEEEKHKVIVAAEWAASQIRRKVRERDGHLSSEPDFQVLLDKIKKDVVKKRGVSSSTHPQGGVTSTVTQPDTAVYTAVYGQEPRPYYPAPAPATRYFEAYPGYPVGSAGGIPGPGNGLHVEDETIYGTAVVPAKVIQLAINPTYDVNTRFLGHDMVQTQHDLHALHARGPHI